MSDFIIEDGVLKRYSGNNKNVIIPYGVKIIGEDAFQKSLIESVVIPDTVVSIENDAFICCKHLKHIDIPDTVKKIGRHAFWGTEWIDKNSEDFNIVGDGILIKYNANEKDVFIPHGVKIIAYEAFRKSFMKCNDMETLVIPDTAKRIESKAFEDCKNLKRVKFSDCLTYIGVDAFRDCRSLEYADLPDSVTTIESGAFCWCKSLEWIKLPKNLKNIADGLLCDNDNLSSIEIPIAVTSIGRHVFRSNISLTDIKIPDSVTIIGECAFEDCKNLKRIKIPDCVVAIRKNAFDKNQILEYHGIEFDLNLLQNPSELQPLVDLFNKKDFSIKAESSIKYQAALKSYLKNGGFANYIKGNFVRIFKFFAKHKCSGILLETIADGKFITRKNIDKLVKASVENQLTEITVTLINIKNENNWFVSADDEFKL